jgi:hypothetical protein
LIQIALSLQLIEENEQLKERVLQLEKQLEAKVSANNTGTTMLMYKASGNECLISLTFIFKLAWIFPTEGSKQGRLGGCLNDLA